MDNITKKVAFRNLGCKVNEYELEVMQQEMVKKGFEIVPFDSKADIYVINTCTVTNIADRKSRQMLHKARKENPDALVVAVGCYVQTDTEGAKKDSAVDIVIGNNHKAEIGDIIVRYTKGQESAKETVSDLTGSVPYEEMMIEKIGEHTRAFIKIQDGCNQFCSYCAIPLARGRIRSRKLDSILKECKALSDNGYQEVVITGIHLSSYGIDLHPLNGKVRSYNEMASSGEFTNLELLEVIRKVSGIEKIKRIRLGSLEPRLITEDFVRELSAIDKICPHFHLSLQSGCDETLKRMNRHYTTQEYRKSVELLREYFDTPAITTDVIVGFPGESDEEFEITKAFLEDIGFFEMHVFKYSERKNTVAANLPGKVSDELKDLRSDELLRLDEKLSDAFRKKYSGRQAEVLFEEQKDGFYTGHTREYIKVKMRSEEDISGEIMKLTIDGKSLKFV